MALASSPISNYNPENVHVSTSNGKFKHAVSRYDHNLELATQTSRFDSKKNIKRTSQSRGVLPEKLGGGVRPTSQNPYSAKFPTLFMA